MLELLVTLALLAAIASVATLGVRRIQRPSEGSPASIVSDSLALAIAEGRTISFGLVTRGRMATTTVYPDGSVIADTIVHIEALTGRPTDAR